METLSKLSGNDAGIKRLQASVGLSLLEEVLSEFTDTSSYMIYSAILEMMVTKNGNGKRIIQSGIPLQSGLTALNDRLISPNPMMSSNSGNHIGMSTMTSFGGGGEILMEIQLKRG